MNEQISLLIKGGLTKLEAKIYTLLLNKEGLNGNQIAENLGVDRSLVYRSLKNLLKQNLVVSSNESYNCKYSIQDTTTLLKKNQTVVDQANESLEAIKDFIDQIPQINLDGLLKSKVKVFRDEESITKVYKERNKSNDKLLREISSDTVFPGIETVWWDEQIKIRKNNKSFLHQLVDKEDSSAIYHRTNKEQYKEVRLVPDDFKINAGINIYGNKVAFHNSNIENPLAIVIEDSAMATLLKNIFDFVWNRSQVI